MRKRAGPVCASLFTIVFCWASFFDNCSADNGVVVSSVLDADAQPPFEFLRVPVSRTDGVRVQGRAGGACVHNGKNHADQEEWAHYTTSQTAKPYYGFKLKCQDGTVQVLGPSSYKLKLYNPPYTETVTVSKFLRLKCNFTSALNDLHSRVDAQLSTVFSSHT